jgi:hypothetical protein
MVIFFSQGLELVSQGLEIVSQGLEQTTFNLVVESGTQNITLLTPFRVGLPYNTAIYPDRDISMFSIR